MNVQPSPSLPELLADQAVIDDAVRRAAREAALKHARAGQPVATWQNGRVVWLPPEEILSRLSDPTTG
jgi:hypothetical protein